MHWHLQETGRRRGRDRRNRARERGAVRALEGKDRTVFPVLHGVQDVLLDRGRDRGPRAVGGREVLADDRNGLRELGNREVVLEVVANRLGRRQEEVHGRHADVDDEDDGADRRREGRELVERGRVAGHGLADRALVRVDDRDPRVDDAADDVGHHLRAALEPARARGGGLDALVHHLLDGVDEERDRRLGRLLYGLLGGMSGGGEENGGLHGADLLTGCYLTGIA